MGQALAASTLTPCPAAGEIWERRGAQCNNCRPVFPPPRDQRQTPRVPRAGACADPSANVPAPRLQLEEEQIHVYVLREEKQHDAAVTF